MTNLANSMVAQPPDVVGLSVTERQRLIVSTRRIDGVLTIVSQYGDDVWKLVGGTTNTARGDRTLNFLTLSATFREDVRAIMYRFLRKGGVTGTRPGPSQAVRVFSYTKIFLEYLSQLGVSSLADATPLVCSTYAQYCKSVSARPGGRRKAAKALERRLSPSTISHRLMAVELIYEMSQYSGTPMPRHPWPETTASSLSGCRKDRENSTAKTPLMPDDVFSTLFRKAWEIVEQANFVLDLREAMEDVEAISKGFSNFTLNIRRNRKLRDLGWTQGYAALVRRILDIRTACYVVIASLSGCRNHELAFVHRASYYYTDDDTGERYWWMRSKSTKTHEGNTEWMIPDAAVRALKVMDRWCKPHQETLSREIDSYRAGNARDVRIGEAMEHFNAVFVGSDKARGNRIRTLGLRQWNESLQMFSKSCGLQWNLKSHHFRRKFANYVARSRFGDLRYLKEHFKHWSFDMMLGYALNESQEMSLYLDIQDELDEVKEWTARQWLSSSEPLAGGYGENIVRWRSREENVTLFKSHAHMVRSIAHSTAIRSNGHAWCTADDDLCVGNDLEPTRCGDSCTNAVIGRDHAPVYQGLYEQLKVLANCEDIGEGGQARVQRDLIRCRSVLAKLGYQVDSSGAET